ncbi:DUF397 domain-containing protein [Streptomyces sp. ID05-39B]|uniref:DUF397 domain-containing protein n=1 Tax=Streptomyces sp. ID05-39B TaxID=3028664 RepID=UPI0029B8ED73|nr:DUF397 domain-containing protein [Streptomyces sp. ID05-39B]MDX3528969.1 DUF397 domain-containing protein [Streptomyces sp. ID05-39B]
MNGKTRIDHARLLEQINAATWVKSRHSGGGTNCVEVAFLPQVVCFRDSKNLDQRPLLFTTSAYDAFIGGLEQSELPL